MEYQEMHQLFRTISERRVLSLMAVGCMMALSGCRTANHAEGGALLGAGLGGTMGAILGSNSGHAGSGAVLGAMTGAVVGGLAGEAEDAREERDAAVAQAQFEQSRHAQQALTNSDLVTMTQNGVSDRVIISAVKSRGGRFDLSPNAIIDLKSHGVSDEVIVSIQESNSAITKVAANGPTIVTLPPTVYVAPPRPSFGIVIGPSYRSHCHPRPYRSHWHHW